MTVEMFVSMLRALRRAGQKGATVQELIDSLGVSDKTVRRTIDEMVQLDLPIVYEETEFGAKIYYLSKAGLMDWVDRMSKEK